jgi:16S rRNA (cytidine1402-2'-O)-methyltransferase
MRQGPILRRAAGDRARLSGGLGRRRVLPGLTEPHERFLCFPVPAPGRCRAAGGQQYPAATLYVVASPIGNLADFSLRAVHALSLVDAVACEDTRVTAGLLRHLGLDKPLIAVHEHNEQSAAEKVLARLAQGERVAYLSDAGTPAVSDPGAVLAHQVRAAGHRVLPLPGASAVVTALSAAGCVGAPGPGFHFAGFLPAKGQERDNALQAALAQPCPTVLFEAPHRIEALADRLAALAPTRPVTVCRELTKQFEQIDTLPAAQLPAWFAADAQRRKGEFAVVLHAPAPSATRPGLPPRWSAPCASSRGICR